MKYCWSIVEVPCHSVLYWVRIISVIHVTELDTRTSKQSLVWIDLDQKLFLISEMQKILYSDIYTNNLHLSHMAHVIIHIKCIQFIRNDAPTNYFTHSLRGCRGSSSFGSFRSFFWRWCIFYKPVSTVFMISLYLLLKILFILVLFWFERNHWRVAMT